MTRRQQACEQFVRRRRLCQRIEKINNQGRYAGTPSCQFQGLNIEDRLEAVEMAGEGVAFKRIAKVAINDHRGL